MSCNPNPFCSTTSTPIEALKVENTRLRTIIIDERMQNLEHKNVMDQSIAELRAALERSEARVKYLCLTSCMKSECADTACADDGEN